MADEYVFALVFGSLLAVSTWSADGHGGQNAMARQAWHGQGLRWELVSLSGPQNLNRRSCGAAANGDESRFRKTRHPDKIGSPVLYAAERAIKEAKLPWRAMAQVCLGEVLASADPRAMQQ